MCTARALYLWCAIAVSGVQPAIAGFPLFEPASVNPGDELVQAVAWRPVVGQRVQIRLFNPPPGARLELGANGTLEIRWQTTKNLADETPIVIRALDQQTGRPVQTRVLVVRNRQTTDALLVDRSKEQSSQSRGHVGQTDEAVLANVAGSVASLSLELAEQSDSEIAAVEATEDELDTPELAVKIEAIPSLIISAGRAVSMQLKAASNDGLSPIMEIDRLPSNASFESNNNGGYTLYWQTASRDQGEHVFRIDARHPQFQAITDSQFLTVVVGDPTRLQTVPESSALSR